jgi:hypothetical protein
VAQDQHALTGTEQGGDVGGVLPEGIWQGMAGAPMPA